MMLQLKGSTLKYLTNVMRIMTGGYKMYVQENLDKD